MTTSPRAPAGPAAGRPQVDVAVLGAGPAGLAAAWWLARAGHSVTVVERSPVPGGLAGSFTVGGVRVDHGSHRLHPATDPAILHDLRRLLGDELQERRRNGRIRLDGRWIAFPLRAVDLVRHLPPGFAAAAARDAVTAPLRRPSSDSFEAVVRAGLGPTMAERFYLPYARKIWGVDPGALSGEQARRRVSAATPAALLRRVAGRDAQRRRVFLYPRGGFGAIPERLAAAAVAAGATLRYGAAVTRLGLGSNGVEVRLEDGTALAAGRVWSTVPVPLLARLADPPPPAAVRRAAAGLAYRALLLVYLVLDVDRYTPFDAHYLPDPATPVTRLSEPKNYRDGDDPAGRTVVCAELPCGSDDPVWSAPAGDVGRLVADSLPRVGLPGVTPVDVVVRRLRHAYPVYRAGYEVAFGVLDRWLSAQPGLLSFGRQGLFAHDNTHHTLAMARAAVDALDRGGRFDAAAWAAARERFRSHVVED